MSLSSPHHCLFCNRLNPAGATFCNECGTQLSLQPCSRCGAANDRAATNCHQCQFELTLPAPATKPDAEPAPPLAERFINSYDRPVRHNLDPGSSPDATRPADLVVAPRVSEAAPLWRRPHNEGALPTASPEMDETLNLWHRLQNHGSEPVTSAGARATTGASRRKLYVSGFVVLLAVAAAGTGYYLYTAQPAQLAQQQGRSPATSAQSSVSSVPKPPEPLSPTVATRAAPSARPTGSAPEPPANARLADAPTAPPLRAGSNNGESARPLPTPNAAIPTRQEAPRFSACPPAVATLGLCEPGTN